MIDAGIQLALAALKYDPNAQIFYAVIEGEHDLVYWQYGRDEQDALRRFRGSVGRQTQSE